MIRMDSNIQIDCILIFIYKGQYKLVAITGIYNLNNENSAPTKKQ